IIAAVPVAKGLSQVIYGLFFAESIKTMTNRMYAGLAAQSPPPREIEQPVPSISFSQTPPASVTERTTNIMGGPRGVQNAQ
ncbi:MAG TPA: hypothetical protein VEZ90_14300, partial [Blastocatellia bacterium]|nr:hypothetical protein [Blastocatellia bacterium]